MERLRIAIAEDQWLAMEDLRACLETLGHEVVGTARTAAELVMLVARERPDLALVDARLARGSDGLRAARAIRRRYGVPAIAVSAHLTAEEAARAGLLGLLSKPVGPTQLRRALAAVRA